MSINSNDGSPHGDHTTTAVLQHCKSGARTWSLPRPWSCSPWAAGSHGCCATHHLWQWSQHPVACSASHLFTCQLDVTVNGAILLILKGSVDGDALPRGSCKQPHLLCIHTHGTCSYLLLHTVCPDLLKHSPCTGLGTQKAPEQC